MHLKNKAVAFLLKLRIGEMLLDKLVSMAKDQIGKCNTVGCSREGQYYAPFEWDRCCKECYLSDGKAYEIGCDKRNGPEKSTNEKRD